MGRNRFAKIPIIAGRSLRSRACGARIIRRVREYTDNWACYNLPAC